MTISKREYERRRKDLMATMGANSIAVVPAAQQLLRNRDVEYPFRQDSDFHYLSGFEEPDAVLVLLPGRAQGQYVMFWRERDPSRELWDGYRAGPEGACADFGADDAFPITDLDDILPGLLEERVELLMRSFYLYYFVRFFCCAFLVFACRFFVFRLLRFFVLVLKK